MEGGGGRGIVVAMAVMVIIGAKVSGATEDVADTGGGGGEGDEGAVQRG